jgi:hypothetical protein
MACPLLSVTSEFNMKLYMALLTLVLVILTSVLILFVSEPLWASSLMLRALGSG